MFGTYSGFKKHLVNIHGNGIPSSTPDMEDNSEKEGGWDHTTLESSENNEVEGEGEGQTMESSSVTEANLNDMCGSLVAQLQTNMVGQSSVQAAVETIEDLVDGIQTQAKEAILRNIPLELSDTVERCFRSIENPLNKFNTLAKRKRYYEDKWQIVQPVEHVLGVRFDVRRDKKTGMYSQVPITDKLVYVPLLETLKSMFNNKEILRAFQQTKVNKGIYEDICDGEYVNTNRLFSFDRHALQLQLYYDDFETANPLGSKKGIHKLGCVYFILRNLPPKFNSVLMNIQLVLLFHTTDIKKYGFDVILKPLVDDLKCLEMDGVLTPMSDIPLRGSIVQITGDNLALHGLFGFVESFSATYCCRFCLADRDAMQTIFSEDQPGIIFRSKELHSQHLSSLQDNPQLSSAFGVKRSCLFNTLEYFHTCDNFAVDIMHDILEGVAQYELKLVYQHLVDTKRITMNDLCERIHAFNYGYMERKNRPTALKTDDSKDLGLNASQAWCLLRNTPLIFGDLFENTDSVWHLLLLLLQIVYIVFSPRVTEGMVIFLKHLISDHHSLFKTIFPNKRLIPKHHFLVHYPNCIRKIGPILHVWCMRFEAKHNFFKRSVKNFKNVTKTMVSAHQSHMAFNWESFNFERFTHGPIHVERLSSLEGYEVICQTLNLSSNVDVHITNWIKYFGTEYHAGLFVCCGIESDMPSFKKIINMIVKDGCGYLVLREVVTLGFDEHYSAFCIEESPCPFHLANVAELFHYKPYDKQFSYYSNGNVYIVPYCHLC